MKTIIFIAVFMGISITADAANSWPTSASKYLTANSSIAKYPSWPTELADY